MQNTNKPHKYNFVQLKDILIQCEQKLIKIDKHPYYQALVENDRSKYESNVNWFQKMKSSGDWDGFIDLHNEIKNNGIRKTIKDDPIQVYKEKEWTCRHGRHRLCILLYLHGENLYIKINKNGHVIDIITHPT